MKVSIKNLVTDVTAVPSMWVYEHYLGLGKLTGDDVMVKSVFNLTDTDPSLSIYVKGGQYKWYDFSSGFGGSKIDLVMRLCNLGFGNACVKIVSDYNEYILNGNSIPIDQFKAQSKYKVTGWERRKWTLTDRDYWTEYEIGSRELEFFKIFPLSHYQLTKNQKELVIRGKMIYGYFTLEGELHKIYQPYAPRERKFLKVKSYLQGFDQLAGKSDTVLITSSLKDVVALYNMGFESVAPDQEGGRLPVERLKGYKRKLTLMNNDEQGIKSKDKYKQIYGIDGIILPMEKDPSDSVKKYGSDKVKPKLNELINEDIHNS